MELPTSILEKLCCDYCKSYLSCGPIFLNYQTNKVCCGRCTNHQRSATNVRYAHYEQLASAILFPCKYARRGCAHKHVFSASCAPEHEQTCSYRKRACPMRSQCKWAGRDVTLARHCSIAHADKVRTNPCVFQHELTRPLAETYLVTAFNHSFVYYINITDTLTVTVRLIGDETTAISFKFTFTTYTGNAGELQKHGVISAANSNSNTPLLLNIAHLTGIFNTPLVYFKLTIEQTGAPLNTIKQNGDALYNCRHNKNGCTYTDLTPGKCKKHEQYYCKYLSECVDCNVNVNRNTLFKHYVLNHGAFRATTAKTFRIREGYKQYCVLLAGDGDTLFLCKFSLACYRLFFRVFSPFAGDALPAFCCEIHVCDPGSNYRRKLTPECDLNSCHDWDININMYNYPMWRCSGLDLCVFIRENGGV